MKDKLLYGTIGLLVGIVVMQWTMPSGRASVVTAPVGVVVAADSDAVLATDGSVWFFHQPSNAWLQIGQLPFAVSEVQFFTHTDGFVVVRKNGDQWEYLNNEWVNNGQPPIGPVANEQSTWGKIKAKFQGKGE